MKIFERIVLVLGLATLGGLLWKLDARVVLSEVTKVGAGFAIILPFALLDHMINAVGWRFSFSEKDLPGLTYRRLLFSRIIGDGINYLTPSATIAGEIVRPALLGDSAPEQAKIASVVIARFTQSVAQALFIMLGLLWVVNSPISQRPDLPIFEFIRRWFFVPMTVLGLTLASFCAYLAWARRNMGRGAAPPPPGAWGGAVRVEIWSYLLKHPGRFFASVGVFILGYLWGAAEILLICGFMGLPLSVPLALTVEVLSSIWEGILFMVPAKIGTQEAGKTAIFAALGLPASQGLAVGVIRHIRELAWAGLAFLLYALRPAPALDARHPAQA